MISRQLYSRAVAGSGAMTFKKRRSPMAARDAHCGSHNHGKKPKSAHVRLPLEHHGDGELAGTIRKSINQARRNVEVLVEALSPFLSDPPYRPGGYTNSTIRRWASACNSM